MSIFSLFSKKKKPILNFGNTTYRCSQCGKQVYIGYKYCKFCGKEFLSYNLSNKNELLQNSQNTNSLAHVDVYFEEAGRLLIDKEKASIGMLQRYFKIGFNRAARLMDQLEIAGVVGPEIGTKPREVLISAEDFGYMLESADFEYKIEKEYESYDGLDIDTYELRKSLHNVQDKNKLINYNFKNIVITNMSQNDIKEFTTKVCDICNMSSSLFVRCVDVLENRVFSDCQRSLTQPRIINRSEASQHIESSKLFLLKHTDFDGKIFYIFSETYNLLDKELRDTLLSISLGGIDGLIFVFLTSLDSTKIRDQILRDFCIFKSYNEVRRYLIEGIEESQKLTNPDSFHTVLSTVDKGVAFEKYCVGLLEINGFKHIETTSITGDHGADIIAMNNGLKFAIQCKYYSGTVGNSAVQEAFSAKSFYDCEIAVVMTNSTFSIQAQEEALKLGVKLWDKDKLAEMQPV